MGRHSPDVTQRGTDEFWPPERLLLLIFLRKALAWLFSSGLVKEQDGNLR
jgi:hypothetical protein